MHITPMHECDNCLYVKYKHCKDDCMDRMLRDAAAAIEALEARLGEAENSVERWKDMYLTKHEPKRGKWITIRLNNGGSYTGCSCCEAPIPTDTMLDYIPESESKYCYSCGAKMEVSE